MASYLENLINHIEAAAVLELEVEPRPADRPRFGGVKRSGTKLIPIVLTSKDYKKYLKNLLAVVSLNKNLFINYTEKQKQQNCIVVGMGLIFKFNYPASTPKKYKIEGKLHLVKPDKDNLIKPVLDVFVKAGIIADDGCINTIITKSVYTLEQPCIELSLLYAKKQ